MKERSQFDYFPEAGFSVAVIKRGGNTYVGTTVLRAEDMDVASSFAGCEFAEVKARVKVLKHERREAKRDLKVLENLYRQIQDLRDFEKLEYTQVCSHIRKQIAIKRAEVKLYDTAISDLRDGFPARVEKRISAAREIVKKCQDK